MAKMVNFVLCVSYYSLKKKEGRTPVTRTKAYNQNRLPFPGYLPDQGDKDTQGIKFMPLVFSALTVGFFTS